MAAHRVPALFIEIDIGGSSAFRAPVKSFAHGLRVRIQANRGRTKGLQTVIDFHAVQTDQGAEMRLLADGNTIELEPVRRKP